MKHIALIIGLLLPLSVSALEYENLSLLYVDAPFSPAEEAGISVLTSLGAIGGYPDGTFRASRTVNRAEFLKIVLASYPHVRVSPSDMERCFPDVNKEDWFSPYVCLAKKRGMVSGYPDGEFKPDRPVNYAEALKILSELYAYVAHSTENEEWFAGYVRAATFHKTALPSSIAYDRPLTRGQMARLAAAFRAEEEGELSTYRLAEQSFDLVVGREESPASASGLRTGREDAEDVEDSEEEEVVENVEVFPAEASFLVLGTANVVASARFQPRDEAVYVRNATIKLRNESDNIEAMYLVDKYGMRIAEFSLDLYDSENLTWKTGNIADLYSIPADGKRMGIEVVIEEVGTGVPEELMQVKWMSLNVSAVDSGEQYQIIATDTFFPSHQTAKANVTEVRSTRPAIVDIANGEELLLAEFAIAGEHTEDALLHIQHITFTIRELSGVQLSDFSLGSVYGTQTIPCTTGEGMRINCINIPADLGTIENGEVLVQLFGTVDIREGALQPTFRIDLVEPGVLGTVTQTGVLGHVRWTDGQGHYTWTALPEPLANGSTFK